MSELGFEVLFSSSETEAKSQTSQIKNNQYPIYFFETNTSGEKLYEEFFTDRDQLDLETYSSLGIIKNAIKKPTHTIKETISELKSLLSQPSYDKAAIINILSSHLPDFQHIETGKSLDEKM